MARIAGVDLPRDKRVEIGLTYIYGIGRPTSNMILEKTGINPVRIIRIIKIHIVITIKRVYDIYIMIG